MTADYTVTIDDIRKTGHCTAGARRWFEAHGLDFRAFLADGMSAETFRATGDGLAATVLAKIEAKRDGR